MTAAADLIRATVTIMSITRCAVRHWRITATADRTAPEPFCPLSRVAARPVAPPSHTVVSGKCGGLPDGPAVGDLFTA